MIGDGCDDNDGNDGGDETVTMAAAGQCDRWAQMMGAGGANARVRRLGGATGWRWAMR